MTASTVVFDVNLSLDGFIAAEGGRPGQPLGEGGDRLREWATGPDAHRAPKPAGSAGALICGRRTYDTSLPGWGAGGPHPPTPVSPPFGGSHRSGHQPERSDAQDHCRQDVEGCE
jgi:hypothetical protein